MSGTYTDTSLNGLNNLVGGFPIGSIMSLTGPPGGGKSILGVQLAHDVATSRGGNITVIDTEGGMPVQREWTEKLNKIRGTNYTVVPVSLKRERDKKTGAPNFTLSYDKKAAEDKETLFVVDCRSAVKLLNIHGRGMTMDISDKGKMALKPVPGQWAMDIMDTSLGQFVEESNTSFLNYDSGSNPFREFGNNQENFPVRANAMGLFMLQAQLLTTEMDLSTLFITHQSLAVTSPYAKPGMMGGSALEYNIKYSLYILQHTQNDGHTPSPAVRGKNKSDRYLWATRHPSKEAWVQSATMNLTREGYKDYTE